MFHCDQQQNVHLRPDDWCWPPTCFLACSGASACSTWRCVSDTFKSSTISCHADSAVASSAGGSWNAPATWLAQCTCAWNSWEAWESWSMDKQAHMHSMLACTICQCGLWANDNCQEWDLLQQGIQSVHMAQCLCNDQEPASMHQAGARGQNPG